MSQIDLRNVIVVNIAGLDAVKLVAHELPDIPAKAVTGIIKGLGEKGVETAKATLMQSRSPLSSGETARRMRSAIDESGAPKEWRISIGPDMEGVPMHTPWTAKAMEGHRTYPRWVSMATGTPEIDAPVQIGPIAVRWGFNRSGVWRFIKQRTARPGHPWMQDTFKAVNKEASRTFGREFYKLAEKLKKEADQITLREFLYNE